MKKKRITKNVIKRFVACLMALALAIGSYVGDWGSLFVHKAYADDARQEVDITVKVSVSDISTNLSEQPTDWKLKKNDDNSGIEAKSVQRAQDILDITFSIASGTQIVSDYKLLYNHVDSEGKTRESWNGTLTENSTNGITAVCNSIKTEYKRSVISVGSIKDGETSEELNDVSISFYKDGTDVEEESVKLEENKSFDVWLSDETANYTYKFSKGNNANLYDLTATNELQDTVSIYNLIVNRKKIELNNDITIEPQHAETVIYKKDTTDKVNANELKSGIEYTLKINKINYESTTIHFTAGTSNMKMSQLTGVSDSKVTLSNKTYKVAWLGEDSNATRTISKDGSNLTALNNEYTLNLGEGYSVTVKSNDATKFINSVEKKLEGSNVTVTLNGSMNNDGSWTGTLNAVEDAVDGYDGNAKVTLNTATGNATVEVEDVDSKPVTELYVNGKYSLKTNPEASTYKILQNSTVKVEAKKISDFEIPVSLTPGDYTIEVYDASGNKMASEEIKVAYKKIDIELYNINGKSTGDWYNSDVEIRSTKKDEFKYVWSDSDNISELPSLSDDIIKEIKADGTVEGYIYAYADRANDTSVYRSEKISIKVDKTVPVMNVSVEETAEWSQRRIIKIADVSDATSGMADSNVYISTEQKNTVEDIKKISTTETIADGKAAYEITKESGNSQIYYLYVVDKAGNYTEKTVDIKNIDRTNPSITELKYYNEGIYNDNPKGDKPAYTIEKRIESILSSNYFVFASKSVRIEFKVSDNLSGVKTVQYSIDGGQNYINVASKSDGTYEIKFPSSEVAESAKKKLKFKIVDNAENELNVDNTTLIVESDETYADKNVHETTLKALDKAGTEFVPEESYISTDFSVKYNVKETFAGIKDVKVTKKYLSNGTATETELVKDSKALNGTFFQSADEGYGTIYEYSENVSISNLADSDGEFTVTLDITYNSGRTEQIQNTYYIDKVAPKISDNIEVKSINNDEGNLENNVTYFKDDVKITFTATDVYMDKVEGAVYKYSSGKALDKYTDGDKEEGKLNVSSTDGNYTVTFTPTDNIGADELIYIVKATDKGGHSTIKESKVFVIDKTNPKVSVPEVEVTGTPGKVYGDVTYYSTDVEISFTATDTNLDKVSGTVYKYNDNKQKDLSYTDNDKVNELTLEENAGKYTAKFTPDDKTGENKYIFIASADDKALNNTKTVSKVFVIDEINPSIKDDNITRADGQTVTAKNGVTYFNGNVRVSVDISDANLNGESAVVKDSNDNKIADLTLTKNGDSSIYTAEYAADGVADGTVMKVEVKATDKAGRESTYVFGSFVIDRNAPVIENIKVEKTGTTSVFEDKYYNGAVKVSFTYKDTNKESLTVKVKNEEIIPSNVGGDQYEFTYDSEINAAEVVIEATDKAGNYSGEHKSSVFYIDRTEPVITAGGYNGRGLSFSSSQLIKPLRSGMTNIYERDNLTIRFNVTDSNVGIDRMEYTYASTGKTETVYANASTDYNFEIPVSADYKDVINVKVYDKSGNVWTTSTGDLRYVIESEAKHNQSYSGSITENNAANGNGFYNSDISLTLNAAETFAGIQKLDYVIGSQISGTYEPDSDEEITEWTSNQLINAAANNNNDVHAEFTLTDNNNRTETVSKDYKIDVTAPVITVTYDNNSPANEKYYNATRTATISILERNMNNDSVAVTVTRDGSPVGVASAFTTNGEIVEADDGSDAYIYTMDYTFAEDGDYEFSVTATDLAGNVTNTAFSDEFTIDLTKPVINISVDGAAQGQTGFYSQAVTATITVTEHNFRAEDFVFNSSSDNNGTAVGSPAIGTFSNDGDVHTATVNYDYDALTTISASYSDMAANAADDVAPITFTVDLIDPEITVSNFVENKTYGKSETVSPEITITDTNFDASAVDIKFTGGKNGVINGSISSSDVANGRVYTISGVETDDVYTIDVSVKDKSGREKTYTSKFRVNRSGSSYALGNSAQTLNKTYVKAVGEDLIVTELNVDSLSSYIITYSRGGVIRQLEENKDYTVSVSMDSNGWQLYTYAINKNLFAEEGEYTINVSSVDEAGNNSDNTAKEQNLTFVVDDTAPTQVTTGIKDGGVYSEDSIDVTVEVYDNVGIKELIVELNGKETKYTEEEINANGGKIVINIPSSDSRQSLKIRTVDYAGNETNVEEYSFTVSTNAWITFKARYATNPLFWVIVAAAVLVIGGGIAFVIVRKKRKDNE